MGRIRARLSTALFSRVAGPDGEKHRERIHGTPGPRWFEPGSPIDKRPNTWAVRYGDTEWKHFLDFFAVFLTVNGEMERLFKHHMEVLGVS